MPITRGKKEKMEKVKEQIERLKGKAEVFLKNNTKAFIVDSLDNYYFCKIILVGEDYLYIENFRGKRAGERDRLVWFDVIRFEEYREEGK